MDGVINKRVSLGISSDVANPDEPDAKSVKPLQTKGRPGLQAPLSNEEASVPRGYSCNLKTKQIARQLGCNVRLVYFYKNNAMNKLKAAGPLVLSEHLLILN